MHRQSSHRSLRTLLAVFAAALLACALASAPAAGASGLDGSLIAAAADESYPDWCDDENDDPADDCPDEEEPPPPPAPPPPPPPPPPPLPDDDGDGIPDDFEQPLLPEPPLWPPTPNGAVARIAEDGRTAIAPKRAPRLVKNLVHAANRITRKPYKWGGGHARLRDSGYDCSGATSYVLRSVGMVNGSMVSGGYKQWGLKGAGRWVNVYANNGHVFMVIAGLRFDTSGAGEHGPRWREEPRGSRGFKLRHPANY